MSGPREGGLRLETRRSDGEWTISVSGELDISSAVGLLDAYAEVEAARPERVVLDLSGLEFMDSAGLRAVLGLDARSRRGGTRLALRRGPEAVHRVFLLTRAAERLPFL
jgi:anti-anti-sigma factor